MTQEERKAKDEISDDKIKESTVIVTSIEDCIKSIEGYFKAGFTRVYMHSTSPDEIKFIGDFCARVLLYFNDHTRFLCDFSVGMRLIVQYQRLHRRKKRLTAKIHGCFTIAGQQFLLRILMH